MKYRRPRPQQEVSNRLSPPSCKDQRGDSDGSEDRSSMPLSRSGMGQFKDPNGAELSSKEDCLESSQCRKRRRDSRDDYYSLGFSRVFLFAALALILLPPTLIANAATSNGLSRNNLANKFSGDKRLSHTRRGWRFLQDENGAVADTDDLTDAERDPIDESIPKNATNETEGSNGTGNSNAVNNDGLVIEVEIAPGEDATNADTIANAIDEQSTSSPTSGTAIVPTTSPTLQPATIDPSSFNTTPSPSVSFEPSPEPTMSPRPTMTMSPTVSPAPSSFPSLPPSRVPSPQPTATSEPSHSPSYVPTISSKPSESPSAAPTEQPSISSSPSADPTISFKPTISAFPSAGPTSTPTGAPSPAPTPEATATAVKSNNMMILTNVPELLDNTTIPIWENVTSQHVIDYYAKFAEAFTNDLALQIVNVETEFLSQRIIEGEETEAETPTSRQEQPIEPPPMTPIEIPGTLKVEIIYYQEVTYETDDVNLTDEELQQRLFVLPFTTDSFHYSMDLYNALNWTSWVMVDTVIPSPPDPPTMPPTTTGIASRLTSAQTFAISASTIIAACLIVLFLLWERNQKGEGHFGIGSPRGDGSASVDSRMHAMQGVPMEETGYHYYERSDSAIEDTGYKNDSIRSAPGHLRRNSINRGIVHRKDSFLDDRRVRSGSKDNFSISSKGKFGTGRSTNSNVSNNSSNTENNNEMSPRKSNSPVIQERYGSPSIPLQVPIRNTSGGSHRNSKSDKNDRPFLPPLPPPSSFSGNTPERPRRNSLQRSQSLESGVPVPLNDSIGRASSAFRRPPSSRAFGLRLSGVMNDDMTDISILTDPFPTDLRRQSGEFAISNPHDPKFDSGRSKSDQFLSPLHIPDEENLNRAPIDPLPSRAPESPIPPMSTMLGLESRPINDAMTPSPFAMIVDDIDDNLGK